MSVIITEDAKLAGACVWWELSGLVEVRTLRDALLGSGVGEHLLPSPTTPAVAFRRAMLEFQSHACLVRATAAGTYAVLPRSEDDSKRPMFTTAWEAQLVNDEIISVSGTVDAGVAADVEFTFAEALQTLAPEDLSQWLTRCVQALSAARLRPRGGLYFVPRDALPVWRSIAACVELTGRSRCYSIPAMQSSEAVSAVLASLRSEANEAIKEMTEELSQGDLKARGLGARAERCRALEAKLAHYAELLGTALPDVTENLSTLAARIGAAEIALSEGV